MKPFDLEAAKRGEPLMTRDGRNATFIGYVPEAKKYGRVIYFIEGDDYCRQMGECGHNSKIASNVDLFMAPKKVTMWANLYQEYGHSDLPSGALYSSKEAAENAAKNPSYEAIAVPVEVEL